MHAPKSWIDKMTRYLPAHQDHYFISFNHAMAGTYETRFQEAPKPGSDAAEADFERRMAEMHRKAEPLLRKLRPGRH